MMRIRHALGIWLIALLLPTLAAAAPPVIQVQAPLLQMARPGSWVPVFVAIKSTDDISGRIRVSFGGGDDSDPVTRDFAVSEGSDRRIVIPKRVPQWAYELSVEVTTRRGRLLKKEDIEIRSGAMSPEALRVVVLGEDPLGWTVLSEVTGAPVPGHPDHAESGFRPVLVQNLLPADLPTHWFGWTSVDILVWSRPDPAALTPEQQDALRGWLVAGGAAFITLADAAPTWLSSPLADLVPVAGGQLMQSVSARDVLRTVAGARGSLPDREPLPLAALQPRGRTRIALADDAGAALLLQAPVGTGQAVLSTFDPSAGELVGQLDRELFWRNLFGLWEPKKDELSEFGEYNSALDDRGFGLVGPTAHVPHADCPAQGPVARTAAAGGLFVPGQSLGTFTDSPAWWAGTREALVAFEGAAPLSLSFILAFGALYLLAIGPLDFLVLRRLKKPMWTWISFPVMAVVFSVGASVVISAQKGGDSEIHCLGLLDVFGDVGVERRTSWCALWSGRREDVRLRPSGSGFVLPATPDDYGEAAWYGWNDAAWDDLALSQQPGSVHLSFEAAQWSASVVRSSSLSRSEAGATWYAADGGTAVHSELGVDLSDAWILDGQTWFRLGPLPDGARRQAIERPGQGVMSDDEHETAWALLKDAVDDPRGHLHLGGEVPVLLGFADIATTRPALDGVAARDRGVALVRVPLHRPAEASP